MTSLTLMVCGVLALLFGITVGPAPATVSAMPALQPSPRPTIQPTPGVTQVPVTTATALPPPVAEDEGDEPEPTAIPRGRVTGTVIDLRTNAPASDKLVIVGDSLAISDSNGNYDRWVISGYYKVGLQLRSGEGSPTQAIQEIAVGPGDTVVVHLFFTSPADVPLVVATNVPAVIATPVVASPPASAPPVLPDTSVAHHAPPARPARAPAQAPSHLPETAAPIRATEPGLWLLAGIVLLSLGLLLQLRPRRRRIALAPSVAPAPDSLLATLLSSEPRPARRRADALLEDLLDREL